MERERVREREIHVTLVSSVWCFTGNETILAAHLVENIHKK